MSFSGLNGCGSHSIHSGVIRPFIFCNPDRTISYTSRSISNCFWMRTGCGVILSSHFVKSDLIAAYLLTVQHILNKSTHLGYTFSLIHNEIPGGFTIGTPWWTLMRCYWKDEPKSALLPQLQVAAWRMKKRENLFCIFCKVRESSIDPYALSR